MSGGAVYVTATQPWPATSGGRMRTAATVAALTRIGPTHLIVFSRGDPAAAPPVDLASFEVHAVPRPALAGRAIMRGVALARRENGYVAQWKAAGGPAELRALVDRLDAQVVILEFPFYPFAAGPLRSAGRRIVADIADDRIAVAREVVHGSRSRKVRWRWRLDAPALGRSERTIELLDQVWFAAERDARAALRDHPGLDVRTIPNIVDVDRLAGIGASATPTSRSAAFIGAYDYAPNENAGLRFAERIAPRLKSNSKAGRLALVGRAPTARIRAAASAAGIELLPDVAEFRDDTGGIQCDGRPDGGRVGDQPETARGGRPRRADRVDEGRGRRARSRGWA